MFWRNPFKVALTETAAILAREAELEKRQRELITPVMIEAGVAAMAEFKVEPGEEVAGRACAAIYRAMRAAAR